jgi:hypothetical protein
MNSLDISNEDPANEIKYQDEINVQDDVKHLRDKIINRPTTIRSRSRYDQIKIT